MADSPPNPFAVWQQSAQALSAWADTWRGTGDAPVDPFTLWQRSVDQWLSTLTSQLEQSLQTPESAELSGKFLDALLNVEKPARDRTAATMQLWLEFMNMPSRHDLLRLATQLNDANARLDELQDQVETVLERLEALTETRRRPLSAAGGAA